MVDNKKYFRSELLAVGLTSLVLLGLLWIANILGLIVVDFHELLIYTLLTILAGLMVFVIRWYIIFKKR